MPVMVSSEQRAPRNLRYCLIVLSVNRNPALVLEGPTSLHYMHQSTVTHSSYQQHNEVPYALFDNPRGRVGSSSC
jgi:hypothetical protein